MKKDFQIIKEEIFRQYELGLKTDETHDTKTGITLGFIGLVLASIMVERDFLEAIAREHNTLFLFILGLLLVTYAAYNGFNAYFVQKYYTGASLSDILQQYRENVKRDYEQVIVGATYEAHKRNRKTAEKKGKIIKRMFVSFLLGFTLILISGIAPLLW